MKDLKVYKKFLRLAHEIVEYANTGNYDELNKVAGEYAEYMRKHQRDYYVYDKWPNKSEIRDLHMKQWEVWRILKLGLILIKHYTSVINIKLDEMKDKDAYDKIKDKKLDLWTTYHEFLNSNGATDCW